MTRVTANGRVPSAPIPIVSVSIWYHEIIQSNGQSAAVPYQVYDRSMTKNTEISATRFHWARCSHKYFWTRCVYFWFHIQSNRVVENYSRFTCSATRTRELWEARQSAGTKRKANFICEKTAIIFNFLGRCGKSGKSQEIRNSVGSRRSVERKPRSEQLVSISFDNFTIFIILMQLNLFIHSFGHLNNLLSSLSFSFVSVRNLCAAIIS